nr:acyltransferase family protein [Flaviflexus huanghaiensis]
MLPPPLRPLRDGRRFRPELHGVRGLAILLVVTFHIFAGGRVSGGIDVFLAITGFLALPSLLGRTRGQWRIDLVARFSDLIRRLVIPLLPVLVAVAIAGAILVPLSEQPQVFSEMKASIFFYENWQLIASQLSYDAAGPGTSPLQHIWSTSIQGQFHVIMTFFVMAVAWAAGIVRAEKRNVLLVALGVVTAASLWWAVEATATYQEAAYFSTFTRAWELTLPGMLGLVVAGIRLSPVARGLLSWIGISLIVSCGFVLDGAALFPGPAALWPVVGVCLVLAAGNTHTRWGADRILVARPFQRLGDISYSLYLWHWPILIFALIMTGQEQADPATAAIVLAVSLVAGTAGKILFEDRAANWRPAFLNPARALATGATTTVLAFIAASGALAYSADRFEAETAAFEAMVVETDYPGAGAMVAPESITIAALDPLPSRDILRADAGWYAALNKSEPCIQRHLGSETTSCQHPEADTGPLVLMVGSSHTGQWSEPLAAMALDYGWDLEVYEKAGCLLTTDGERNTSGLPLDASCVAWNENMQDVIAERQPELVVTTGTTRLASEPETATPGMVDAVRRITDAGIPVFLFRENPHRTEEWLECLAADSDSHTRCEAPREAFYSAEIDRTGLPQVSGSARAFDTSRYLCDEESCYGQVGNVRVLRDDNHVTATFASSARAFIESDIRALVPHVFETPTTALSAESGDVGR